MVFAPAMVFTQAGQPLEGTVRGKVFLDYNRNGILDPREPGVPLPSSRVMEMIIEGIYQLFFGAKVTVGYCLYGFVDFEH